MRIYRLLLIIWNVFSATKTKRKSVYLIDFLLPKRLLSGSSASALEQQRLERRRGPCERTHTSQDHERQTVQWGW
jgi:hypothetical protein